MRSGPVRLFSRLLEPAPDFVLARALFLRALAVIGAIAFASFAVQVRGLVGAQGIAPAADWLGLVKAQLGFFDAPTLFWWGAPDTALVAGCWAGVAVSVLLFLGIAPRLMLACAWALYLSLVTVGSVFMSFQWDLLLLEAGVLAFFLAPPGLWPELRRATAPPRWTLLLLWFLVFKLMVLSGLAKLLSGDPTWRNLTALEYHYWTQPLPTWLALWAARAPAAFQQLSAAMMFVIELVVPWLVWFGRRPRRIAAAALALLQLSIAVTGNYGFFNYLTLVLCLPLVDDAVWRRLLPLSVQAWFERASALPRPGPAAAGRAVLALAGLAVFVLSAFVMLAMVMPGAAGALRPLARAEEALEPFRSINGYGLFAVMTTTRPELLVEGSDDGVRWRPYVFRYKPGPLTRAPRLVAPYQPRLDWQMWFAALGTCRRNPWFVSFQYRLLTAEPAVLRLLGEDPFRGARPKYVRSQRYQYRFASAGERARTGEVWTQRLEGSYCPVLTLDPGGRLEVAR